DEELQGAKTVAAKATSAIVRVKPEQLPRHEVRGRAQHPAAPPPSLDRAPRDVARAHREMRATLDFPEKGRDPIGRVGEVGIHRQHAAVPMLEAVDRKSTRLNSSHT